MGWADALACVKVVLSPNCPPSMKVLRKVSERILKQCIVTIPEITVRSVVRIDANELIWAQKYAQTLHFEHG